MEFDNAKQTDDCKLYLATPDGFYFSVALFAFLLYDRTNRCVVGGWWRLIGIERLSAFCKTEFDTCASRSICGGLCDCGFMWDCDALVIVAFYGSALVCVSLSWLLLDGFFCSLVGDDHVYVLDR